MLEAFRKAGASKKFNQLVTLARPDGKSFVRFRPVVARTAFGCGKDHAALPQIHHAVEEATLRLALQSGCAATMRKP
jgi:hypothetical protein